jgi:hypothetical protein
MAKILRADEVVELVGKADALLRDGDEENYLAFVQGLARAVADGLGVEAGTAEWGLASDDDPQEGETVWTAFRQRGSAPPKDGGLLDGYDPSGEL